MRALFTNLPIAFLGLALLASCGKENASGGGSSTSASVSVSASSDIGQIRNAFNNRALNYGLSENLEIYHGGSYFKSSSNSNCKEVDLWGFELGSYCYGTSQGQHEYFEIKKVQSASSGSLKYKEAIDTRFNGSFYVFEYGDSEKSFDRNSTRYKEMLGLSSSTPVEVRTSNATIKLSNDQIINGVYVEYFYGTKTNNILNITSIDAFVLSTELPVLANPVTVEENRNVTAGPYRNFIGGLSKIGNSNVVEIKVSNSHYVERQWTQDNYGSYKSVIRSHGQERTF